MVKNIFGWKLMLVVSFLLMSVSAFAAEAGVVAPIAEVAGKVGMWSAVLAFGLQLAKSDLLGGLFAKVSSDYQPAVVLLLGQLGALIESVGTGKSLGQASLEWLMSSGNAMALFNVVIKPFTNKKPKKK